MQILGSPPLTRGIHPKSYYAITHTRFTPAHAGNTILDTDPDVFEKVHPRSRGEYTEHNHRIIDIQGSPPLTRGILLFLI